MRTQGVKNNSILNRANSLVLCDREHQKVSFNVVRSIRILITCHSIPQTTAEAVIGCTVKNMQILMFMAMMVIM
jgi:hypothetical protein